MLWRILARTLALAGLVTVVGGLGVGATPARAQGFVAGYTTPGLSVGYVQGGYGVGYPVYGYRRVYRPYYPVYRPRPLIYPPVVPVVPYQVVPVVPVAPRAVYRW